MRCTTLTQILGTRSQAGTEYFTQWSSGAYLWWISRARSVPRYSLCG